MAQHGLSYTPKPVCKPQGWHWEVTGAWPQRTQTAGRGGDAAACLGTHAGRQAGRHAHSPLQTVAVRCRPGHGQGLARGERGCAALALRVWVWVRAGFSLSNAAAPTSRLLEVAFPPSPTRL